MTDYMKQCDALSVPRPRGGTYLEVGSTATPRRVWFAYDDVQRVVEFPKPGIIRVVLRDDTQFNIEADFDEFVKNLP